MADRSELSLYPDHFSRAARMVNASRFSEEHVMKPKRKKPPWWFAPALVTGFAAAGGVLAMFFTLAE